MGLKRVILTLFLLVSTISNSQNLVYKFLTIKEGLPTNNIFKIQFDKKGFLWIAHDNGISKYDGFTFKHYVSPLQKSNVYTELIIGPDGRIWVTNLGLQVFYIENDDMKLFKSFNLNFPPSTIKISFLKNGNLIVNAEGGLYEYDFKKQRGRNHFFNLTIQNFFVNKDVVYFNNPQTHKLFKYENGRVDSMDMELPLSIIMANDSCIISGYNVSDQLLIRYGQNFSKKLILPLAFNYNHSEFIDNFLFVFTTGNVIKINLRDGNYTSSTIIDGRSYTHFTRDKFGNEWFSTLNEGIIIKPYSNIQIVEVSERSPFIKLVQFKNFAYGITTDNRLFKMYADHVEQVLDIKEHIGNKPIIVAKNLNDQYLLLGNSHFILVDTSMNITKYFQQLALKDASIHDKGNIYMATTGNILYHRFNKHSINYIASRNFIDSKDTILKRVDLIGRFNCVKYDSTDKTLYFGGIPGFYKMQDGKRFEEIKYGDKQIFSSFIDVYAPNVIVGTIQSGIFILRNGTIYKHYNGRNSSLGNTIVKIKLYENKIWVLSNKGIHSIDLGNFNIQTYSYIGAVELNRNTDFTLSNDILYLIAGLKTYKVNLSELRKSPPVIPVYFNYLELGPKRIFDLKNLIFRHDENSFSVGIEMPAASVLGNVEFEYSLNNKNWFLLSNGQSKIYLSQLSPGSYTLYVRQIGIPKTYSMHFNILTPYWKQWWFFVLIIFSLLTFIAILYINRINTIRQKTRSEIEKFKLEKALQLNVLSSIRSQMNPHFLFNALNTIQSYIYLNDKKQAINYLGKFSVLTRKILDESNRETIALAEEMETLELYLQLEKMRFENTLDYSLVLENIKFPEQYKIPPMLIQPYIENAVKHGLMHKHSNRKIIITFTYNEEQQLLQVQVDDNGIGRKRSEEINFKKNAAHRSFSTKANKTRLDILNSDRENPISVRIIDKVDEYNNPLGTTVQINIPVL